MDIYNRTKWLAISPTINEHPKNEYINYLSRRFIIDPHLMHWLYVQGFNTEEKIERLFFPTMSDFHNPFLLNDMKKALFRIIHAIKQQEKILIFGDYDCDGITATCILYKALKSFNANVSFRLPLREEGYGITEQTVEEAASKDISLIITVDNGSSAHDAVRRAKELGIDVIISDHHDILQGHPNCNAFINPKRTDNTYPFPDLSGAGVALKITEALYIAAKRPWHKHSGEYIELATIGTIADLVSLQGENRSICYFGLKRMNICPQPNLKKLFKALNIKSVSSSTIGFLIGPILNAVGRVHDPNFAVNILISNATTKTDFNNLIKFNKKRKDMTMVQYLLAEEDILENKLYNQNVIVVHGDYYKGIIGIIASRISEKFKKPSIVISECGTASCRGVNGSEFSMIDTLQRCSDLFKKYGGHKAAAGFSIETSIIDDLKRDIQNSAKQEGPIVPSLLYLCPLSIDSISNDFISDIDALEPFGMGFKKPNFFSGIVNPSYVTPFGMSQEHLNIYFGNKKVSAFSLGKCADQLRSKQISFLYTTQWNAKDEFMLQDIKLISK
jgi:single-stranded-DNA-specific exonuclease